MNARPLDAESVNAPHNDISGPHASVRRLAATLRTDGFARPASSDALRNAILNVGADAAELAPESDSELPSSLRWVMDNYALVARAVPERSRFKLPASGDKTRVEILSAAIAEASDSLLTYRGLLEALQCFIDITPLTTEELWALRDVLKREICERFLHTARHALRSHQLRLQAERWAERLENADAPRQMINAAPREPSFRERLLQLMRQRGNVDAVYALETESAEQVEQEHASQARDALLLGNAMASIRLLDSISWRDIVEALSDVEQWLRCDPSGIYPLMDAESRDMCRKRVCGVAALAKVSQGAVAKLCVMLARGAGQLDAIDEPRQAANDSRPLDGVNVSGDNLRVHVGWWLLTLEGRRALYRALTPETFMLRAGFAMKRHARAIYMSGVLLVAALLVLLGIALHVHWGFIVLGIPVYMACASLIVNRAVNAVCPPARLPKLRLDRVPDSMRTLVVIPALLSHADRARELMNQLASMASVEDSPNVDFMLLGDYSDSLRAEEVSDADISSAAAELAARYNGLAGRSRFFYIQRPRTWSDKQKRFSGRERKRGALMALNQFLLTGNGELAGIAPEELTDRYAYVITLDADTTVPPGALRELIGTLSHPLNRRRMETGHPAGYSVLQPRMELAARAAKTKFVRLFGGDGGVDTYVSAVSDVYQDLCGEGAYTGKGIYDLRAFDAALRGVLPDDSILSHDLLEGCLAGAGLIEDVVLYDGYPTMFKAYEKRLHRWTRGDWQLLPYLLPRIRTQNGSKESNPLNAFSRWKIAANLWRSLSVPCSLIMALGGLWLGNLYLLLLGLGQIWLPCALNLFGRISGRALLLRGVQTSLWPKEAAVELGAIARTLFRLLITHKHMLDWVTSADAEKQNASNDMGVCFVAAVLALPGLFAPGYQFISFILAITWAVAPLICAELAKPANTPPALTDDQREYLTSLARDTWRFFETCMSEDDGLPPDNVQLDPPLGSAARTSPTNIGMYMISALSAYRLDFISGDELVYRLQRTADKLTRLEKWQGHMYNWYDINTLEPLKPLYVSSVDSGNLAGCLICCVNALTELSGRLDSNAGIPGLVERMKALLDGMDFSLLYDPSCNLFHIGCNIAQNRLSDAHYDLMGSEARLLTFSALMKGDVPIEHWYALGRAVTRAGDGAALMSWSGTMFEYLMPQLVIPSPWHTLLGDTVRNVVLEQIYSAQERPWGVSESGYYAFDAQLNYQYRAFGLPSLALGRAQCDVIAPYACEMAAMLFPSEAVDNLQTMQRLGFRGTCGFYEAIDYSCAHIDAECRVVKSYMAHHQGMALAAICNALTGNSLVADYMNSPRAQALSVLLEEKRPRIPAALSTGDAERNPDGLSKPNDSLYSRAGTRQCCPPDAHLLNGADCACFVTARGDGWLSRDGITLNRWRGDCIRPEHGFFVFLSVDGEIINAYSGERHSAGDGHDMKPCDVKCSFEPGCARWILRHESVVCRLELCVSPENGALYQQLTLESASDKACIISATNCFEVSLSRQADDEAHPAFRNLFVQSKAIGERALLFTRRKRSESEVEQRCAHILSFNGEGSVSYETSRLRAWGRDSDRRVPKGLYETLSCETGDIVDPCSMLRGRIVLEPRRTRKLLFTAQFVSSETDARGAVEHCQSGCAFDRARELAVTRALAMVKFLCIGPTAYKTYQRAAAFAAFSNPPRSGAVAAMADVRGVPRGDMPILPTSRMLWQLGISGDMPVVLINLLDESGHAAQRANADGRVPAIVRETLHMHELWRSQGFVCDFVIVYPDESGYDQPTRDSLQSEAVLRNEPLGKPGGLYMLCASQLTCMQRETLYCAACLVLEESRGGIAAQLPIAKQTVFRENVYSTRVRHEPVIAHGEAVPSAIPDTRTMYNGWGGFGQAHGIPAYIIDYDPLNPTPAPWVNVLSNPEYGAIVTEAGGGHIWRHNSRQFQITPWQGDPLYSDKGFAMYIQGTETGEYTLALSGGRENAVVMHMPGVTRALSGSIGLDVRTDEFVDSAWPIFCIRASIKNASGADRRLSIYGYADWRLGSGKNDWRYIKTAQCDDAAIAMSAQPGRVSGDARDGETQFAYAAFIGADSVTVNHDKLDFLGIGGDAEYPRALNESGAQPVMKHPSGLPCAWLQTAFELKAGEEREISLIIGCEDSLEQIRAHRAAYRKQGARHRLELTEQLWRERLGRFTIDTPDGLLNAMANTFLPLQVQSSRVWGRTGYYQLGGAFGFRDQLQDMMALIPTHPDEVRAHILECAAHQFEDGDVQHWWHRPYMGVRTRITDDMLFLPYVTATYIEQTGNYSILRAQVPFLINVPIPEGREDWYGNAEPTMETAPLHEHNLRAINRACHFGAHGLPLMGCGDWNDGMNRVGEQGTGESVWLGMFLCEVLRVYAPHCDDPAHFDEMRQSVLAAIEASGWDGAWYRRAYFDDGTPLGSADGKECRIDLLSQAWAGMIGLEHAGQALDSAWEQLVDREHGIVRLLTPPFTDGELQPGYIKGYLPGIRENGGQYTHAAAWLLMALARSGQAERAWEVLRMLLPANHSGTREQALRYAVEPYVLAADVYGEEPNAGRGGWTWYTGSAAWLLYAIRHSLLGISIKNRRVRFDPLLPEDWNEISATYKYGSSTYRLVAARGASKVTLDGFELADNELMLVDDGRAHEAVFPVRR